MTKNCGNCFYSEIEPIGRGWCSYCDAEVNGWDEPCPDHEPKELMFEDEPDFWSED